MPSVDLISAFVVGLLAFAMTYKNMNRIDEVFVGFAKLELMDAQREAKLKERVDELSAMESRVTELEAQVKALQAAQAAPADAE